MNTEKKIQKYLNEIKIPSKDMKDYINLFKKQKRNIKGKVFDDIEISRLIQMFFVDNEINDKYDENELYTIESKIFDECFKKVYTLK